MLSIDGKVCKRELAKAREQRTKAWKFKNSTVCWGERPVVHYSQNTVSVKRLYPQSGAEARLEVFKAAKGVGICPGVNAGAPEWSEGRRDVVRWVLEKDDSGSSVHSRL